MITSFCQSITHSFIMCMGSDLLCKTPTLDGVCRIFIFTIYYFKGGKTVKDLLMAPKDKEHITKKEWHL